MEVSDHIIKSEAQHLVDKTVGKLLIDAGLLALSDVEIIARCQTEHNLRFGEAAVLLGLVRETDIIRMLASQFEYAYLQPEQGGFSQELIAAYNPFCEQVEQLRKLRTQIKIRQADGSRNMIAIVGINSGNGCSYLAGNLGTVFSQLGERTVLIDANLRRPRQHELFNLPQRQGLSDFLAGRCGIDVVTKISELKGLSVLPAGTVPPNPQELLSKPAFGALLRDLGREFDVILMDTSAATLNADSQIVSAKAGEALIIVRKHKTRAKDLANVINQLKNAKVGCIGAILNNI